MGQNVSGHTNGDDAVAGQRELNLARGETSRNVGSAVLRSWQFAAFAPEVHGEGDGNYGKDAAEFIDEPLRLPSVTRYGSENALDLEVVAGMEERAGPEAAGFEAHPGKNKTHGNNQQSEASEAIPRGSAGVVVRENQYGIVPE